MSRHDWLWFVEAAVARELNLMQRLIDEATEQAKSTQVTASDLSGGGVCNSLGNTSRERRS